MDLNAVNPFSSTASIDGPMIPPPPLPPPPLPLPPPPPEATDAPEPPKTRTKRRRRRALRTAVPAWAVSFVVHVVVLTALGLATFQSQATRIMASINSALVSTKGRADELTPIYADPSNQRSEQAVGGEGSPAGSESEAGGIGSGPPSATPRVAGVGNGIGEKSSLPGVKIVANASGLSLMPAASKLGVDLGGGGMIGGDVTYEASDVGVALDQIAREILRHLTQHKLTVVWLFDESESMKDDQKAIKSKFDRVASELKANVDEAKKRAGALTHSIVGFGKDLHFELEKPTQDIDQISRAIDRLKIDDSGIESTMHAVHEVIAHYSGIINKDRKLLIVLVTDESGDDGSYVEEARQAAVNRGVPIYVIGRQALFGLERAHLRYVDPVSKEVFWPAIRRGPETADLEVLQWDGLTNRQDEHPSGFAPYELARLAKDTGGIYFILPSEEEMRVHRQEKAYSIQSMKELVPDYGPRGDYVAKREHSEFRRTLHDIIATIQGTSYKTGFPVAPAELVPAATEAGLTSNVRLNILMDMEKRLESLRKLRDLEPDKRWQAHYDYMLAQIVAYQIKAYEYGAVMSELARKPPKPGRMPGPQLSVWWQIHHAREPKAPKEKTAKKYAEAERLFKLVIERYPRTPWADLAQAEINRGFSVGYHEAHDSPHPLRAAREKFVPKY